MAALQTTRSCAGVLVGAWVRARSAMPRGKGRGRREREEEQRSLRRGDSEESEESEDEDEVEEYDKSVDHASTVAITDADIDGATTYYTIEVYSGEPPKWTWRVTKRYSEVDEFRKGLGAVKRWKKDLPGDFPKKLLTLTQLDKAAQDERKRKLELWLNNVLAIADQKRTTSLRKGLEDMSVKALTRRARQIDVDEDELNEPLNEGDSSDEDGDGHTYKPQDKVEVFSKSASVWCTGEVQVVDPEAGTVKVQYTNDKGEPMQKLLQTNSEDIRPDVKNAVIALILEAMRAGTGGQQLQELRQELSPKSEKGAQLVSDFLAPESDRDVGPVTKPAALDRDHAHFDRDDELAYGKKERSLRNARKRDPEFQANAEARKKEAIQSPASADGSSRYDSDDSDDSDEEDCSERAEECLGKVQDCMSDCFEMVKTFCEDCAAKCKEYNQVDSDEEDEERPERTRSSRAGTAPARLSSR